MEQRQKTVQEPEAQDEEIAAVIYAVLAGLITVSSVVGAVASLLSRLPDFPSLGGSESDEDGRTVRQIASMVVRDRPGLRGDSETLRNTQIENLVRRAHYAINATKRVVGAEDTRKAFQKELSTHYQQHREAERRRTAGARMVDAAIELHGPTLGWRHGHPTEPRPTHAAADGKNFDARTIPISTGALPGVLPNCTCTIVAPFPKARVLH